MIGRRRRFIFLSLKTILFIVSFFVFSSYAFAQQVNINNVDWGGDLDVSGWSSQITLSQVQFLGNTNPSDQVCLRHDGDNFLTPVDDGSGNGTQLEGNLWIFAFQNGMWRASTWEFFRPGGDCGPADGMFARSYQGGALNNSALNNSNFYPQPGQQYGFMITGLARAGSFAGANESIRSNIVMATWNGPTPTSGGSGGGGSGSGYNLLSPDNAFYSKVSSFTNNARSKGIYTIVQVYNMWFDDPGEGWNANAFNPANNINPETDYFTDEDVFAVELSKALANDMSQNAAGRQFLRNVWQTMIQNLAQNTPPDHVLLEPLVEPFKDEGIPGFNTTAMISQTSSWWGKGNVVDNTAGRNDQIRGGAIYRDYHDNSDDPSLIGSNTIIDTDVQCSPPSNSTITNMSSAARSQGGNYLVYDCDSSTNWNPRVMGAINSALGGTQPSATMGRGTLIGYGGSDFWPNVNAESFLQSLKNAGGNLTFMLTVGNIDVNASTMPWTRGSSLPPPPPSGRVITSVSPTNVQSGEVITINGTNLSSTVQTFTSNNVRSTYVGTINSTNTQVTLLIPSELANGSYTLKVGPTLTDVSNAVAFLISGSSAQPPVAPPPAPIGPPIITGISPTRAVVGQTVRISGTNLPTNITLENASGQKFTITGRVNNRLTALDFEVPSLAAGTYKITVSGPNGSATSSTQLTIIRGGPSFIPPFLPQIPVEGLQTFDQFIVFLFQYALSILGIAVFVMIFYAGVLWFTAAGNLTQVAKARSMIFNAIIGAILLVSSVIILNTLNPDLTGGTLYIPPLDGIEAQPPTQGLPKDIPGNPLPPGQP